MIDPQLAELAKISWQRVNGRIGRTLARFDVLTGAFIDDEAAAASRVDFRIRRAMVRQRFIKRWRR